MGSCPQAHVQPIIQGSPSLMMLGTPKWCYPYGLLWYPTVKRGSRVSIAAPMKAELREIGGVSYAGQCNVIQTSKLVVSCAFQEV